MLKWFVAIALLALSAGAQYWAIQRRSARACRGALEVAGQAGRVRAWLAESEADPFLKGAPMLGPTGAVIEELLQRARWISSEASGSRLPPEAQKAFLQLGLAGKSTAPLDAALAAAEKLRLQCDPRFPATEETQLHFRVSEAGRAWDARKKQAQADKVLFEADRQIYCKGDELLLSLRKVVAAREARCQAGKLPPKVAAACKAGKNEALAAEVADLEAQKEFNLKKMRAKWPAGVVEGISCGS